MEGKQRPSKTIRKEKKADSCRVTWANPWLIYVDTKGRRGDGKGSEKKGKVKKRLFLDRGAKMGKLRPDGAQCRAGMRIKSRQKNFPVVRGNGGEEQRRCSAKKQTNLFRNAAQIACDGRGVDNRGDRCRQNGRRSGGSGQRIRRLRARS